MQPCVESDFEAGRVDSEDRADVEVRGGILSMIACVAAKVVSRVSIRDDIVGVGALVI